MANCVLAHPDRVLADPAFATVAITGGSWQAGLPLANLLRPEFAYLARSTDLAAASTQFWVDLGVTRDIRVAAVPRSNLSSAAQIRLRGCTAQDAGTAVCDTGWTDIYPVIYPPGSLFWGNPSLWRGRMSAEDAALFPMPWSHVWPGSRIARWWLLEISDPANPAGYVQLPRILLSPGWQPSLNMVYGASLAIEDPSLTATSLGGAVFFDRRTKSRVVRFSLADLPDSEALVQANDMVQRLGTSGQLFFAWDPQTPQHAHRRDFLARMRTLSALEAAAFGRMTATYELVEITA